MAARKPDPDGKSGSSGQLELGVAPDAAESHGTFEGSVRRLGEIVEKLEAGDLPLEESLELFEEGIRLARASHSKLNDAEKRVEELLGIDDDGEPVTRSLDPE